MDSTAALKVVDRFLKRYPNTMYDFCVGTEANNLYIEVREPLHQFRNAGEIIEVMKK